MDLSNFASAGEKIELHLTRPVSPFDRLTTDEGDIIGLMIADPESSVMKNFDRALMNSRLLQGRKGALTTINATQLEEQAKQRLACSVVGFLNIKVDGKVLEWSPTAASDLLERFVWIRQQVDEFLGNAANFIKVS